MNTTWYASNSVLQIDANTLHVTGIIQNAPSATMNDPADIIVERCSSPEAPNRLQATKTQITLGPSRAEHSSNRNKVRDRTTGN